MLRPWLVGGLSGHWCVVIKAFMPEVGSDPPKMLVTHQKPLHIVVGGSNTSIVVLLLTSIFQRVLFEP